MKRIGKKFLFVFMVMSLVGLVFLAGCSQSIKVGQSVPSDYTTKNIKDMRFSLSEDWSVVDSDSDSFLAAKYDDDNNVLGVVTVFYTGDDVNNPIHTSDNLDNDVSDFMQSNVSDDLKSEKPAKGSDGDAVIYRYKNSVTSENKDYEGYDQITFTGKDCYRISAYVLKDDFDKSGDELLTILNSQKLSNPQAPQKISG